MFNSFTSLWKRITSFSKTDWELDDYPLSYTQQKDLDAIYRGDAKPWMVQIINWYGIIGLGDTKEEAYQMLRKYFNEYKLNNQLPRPGSSPPLQFADTAEIDKLEDIAVDFFEKILEMNYYECFISDESSLFDFNLNETETLNKINFTYQLELTELGDGNFVQLLKLIKEKNQK